MMADYLYSTGCLAKGGLRVGVRRRRIEALDDPLPVSVSGASEVILINACYKCKVGLSRN